MKTKQNFVLLDTLVHGAARRLRQAAEQNPPASAAMVFDDADVSLLERQIRANAKQGQTAIVDFSRAQSLGAPSGLQKMIGRASTPFIAAIKQTLYLRSRGALAGAPLLLLTDDFRVKTIERSDLPRNTYNQLKTIVEAHKRDWLSVRQFLVEHRFASLAESCVSEPPPGREYIHLPDSTAANKWVGVKELLEDPKIAFEVAYEFVTHISPNFTSSNEFTALATGSNTGFLLGCYVQMLLPGLKLFMIDRLGPFPRFGSLRTRTLDSMAGHRLCIIEDVISTGRELDLIAMFALSKGASITKVIALFDLEVARPLLVPPKSISALCRLSRLIDYKRIPLYDLLAAGKA